MFLENRIYLFGNTIVLLLEDSVSTRSTKLFSQGQIKEEAGLMEKISGSMAN
jgi:hypothetical protein